MGVASKCFLCLCALDEELERSSMNIMEITGHMTDHVILPDPPDMVPKVFRISMLLVLQANHIFLTSRGRWGGVASMRH